MNINRRKAVTLVEVVICVVLFAMLIAGLMRVFSSGMKTSVKGLAHQANMETASIIMSQIEYDLLRATNILQPDINLSEDFDKAIWNFYYGDSEINSPATVTYARLDNGVGVSREVKLADGKTMSNIFARDQKVELSFKNLRINNGSTDVPLYKHAMLVKLTVSTRDSKKVGTNPEEAFSLSRLIIVRGHE